jgi:hypothetical protein
VKTLLKITVAVVAVLVAIGVFLGAFTFPREVLNFNVSFTIGADVKRELLEIPFMNDLVMVEVMINSGSALWNARILNGEEIVWDHSAAQGGQTTYNSEWLEISTGLYNFSFATAGAGSLSAEITVTSKGGFW